MCGTNSYFNDPLILMLLITNWQIDPLQITLAAK